MALVSSSSAPTANSDPTDVLRTAIANFEQALTGDQRLQFHGAATSPQPSDIIAFVSQIDANSQLRAGRCIASRLSYFLDAAKQFVGVVDTFSSGSQVAALVWGSLKFTITAASNVLSYFEKVTDLIMTISRSTPVYSQFGLLYPGSLGLQEALCEYYASIIRLCTKIVENSQRAGFTSTLMSIVFSFETEFKPFRDQLDQDVERVRMHISLASKEESRSEHRANQQHRRLAAVFRSEARRENEETRQWRMRKISQSKDKLKSAIMSDLSNQNHFKTWNHFYQQRAPNTAEWLQQEPSFLKWKDDSTSTVLWCSGTLGIGKTILMSSVIAHLQQKATRRATVCYHFCLSEDQTSSDVRSILGTIVRQMIENDIGHLSIDDLKQLRSQSRDLTGPEAVVDLVIPMLKHEQTYYVVFDGLDEMETADILLLVECVLRLSKHCLIKIAYSGRPELERHLFRQIPYNYKITVTRSRTKQDVDRFATAELIRCLDKGMLKVSDPAIILTMVEDLKCESEEMFLWTKLFIEEMCAQQSENDVLRTLHECPRKLSQLVDRKLDRLQKDDARKQATKMLKYCCVLRRPLTIDVYRELLSIKHGQQSLDGGELPTHMDRVIIACCGLVFVDEQEQTLHYVHHSVRKHLLRNLRLDNASETEIDIQLGGMCLTYLNFNDFQRQMTKHHTQSTTALQPIQLGLTPLVNHAGSERVSKLAQHLLRQRQLKSLKIDKLEQRSQELINDPVLSAYREELQGSDQQYLFLDYARTHWFHHFRNMNERHQCKDWRMFRIAVVDDTFHSVKPWSGEVIFAQELNPPEGGKIQKMFQWTVKHGHYGILLYLLIDRLDAITEHMKMDVLTSDAFSLSLQSSSMLVTHAACSQSVWVVGLAQAALRGDIEAVERFISLSANPNALPESILVWKETAESPDVEEIHSSALFCAAFAGHHEVLDILLKAGADVNDSDEYGMTALSFAAMKGRLEVVQKLLAAGANADGDALETESTTASEASNLDPTLPYQAKRTPLLTPLGYAALGGFCKVVDELVAAGADLDACESNRSTAIYCASEHGHLEVVETLLAAGADVDRTSRFGGPTALSKAAEHGHIAIVDRLLKAGADVSGRASNNVEYGHGGWPVLCAAARNGHLEVVETLLAAGANVGIQSVAGLTPLDYAAERGHVEMVERLLPLTAPSDKDVRKLMKAASQNHHQDVVQRLKVFSSRR